VCHLESGEHQTVIVNGEETAGHLTGDWSRCGGAAAIGGLFFFSRWVPQFGARNARGPAAPGRGGRPAAAVDLLSALNVAKTLVEMTVPAIIDVPMDKLDTLVADHIEYRLLLPKRLEEILSSVLHRREDRAERRAAHIADLRKRTAESEAKLKRLYDAIENGIADLSDPMLTDRLAELKAIRDQNPTSRRGKIIRFQYRSLIPAT